MAEEAAVTAETMETCPAPVRRRCRRPAPVAGARGRFSGSQRHRRGHVEGALSVVAGLVDKPVIAVPTSIGYGASFEGVAALLGMLNSAAAASLSSISITARRRLRRQPDQCAHRFMNCLRLMFAHFLVHGWSRP